MATVAISSARHLTLFQGDQSHLRKVSADAAATVQRSSLNINRSLATVEQSYRKVANQSRIALNALRAFTAASATAAVGIGVRDHLEMSRSMGRIATITDKATFNLKSFEKQLQALSRTYSLSQAEQAAAAYQAISAGAESAGEAITLLHAANKLAIGGGTDLTVAVNGLTSLLNSYGESAEAATKYSDILFKTEAAGKTSVKEISASLGDIAPVAADLGVEFKEVAAAIAALTKPGSDTSKVITSLSGFMLGLLKPTSEATRAAQEMGLQFDAAALRSKGLAGFLNDVAEKTKGSGEQMARLIGSQQALAAVTALTGTASKDFINILRDMDNAAGATSLAFNQMTEQDFFKYQKSLNNIRVGMHLVASMIVNTLSPAFRTLAENIDKVRAVWEKIDWGLMGAALSFLIPGGLAAKAGVKAGIIAANTSKAGVKAALMAGGFTAGITAKGMSSPAPIYNAPDNHIHHPLIQSRPGIGQNKQYGQQVISTQSPSVPITPQHAVPVYTTSPTSLNTLSNYDTSSGINKGTPDSQYAPFSIPRSVLQESLRGVREIEESYQNMAVAVNSALTRVGESLTDYLFGVQTSTSQLLASIARDITSMIIRTSVVTPLSEALTSKLQELNLSHSVKGYAAGGSVYGGILGKRDSIPAFLDHGEFVVRASVAEQFRPFLERLNATKYAAGGAAGGRSIPAAAGSPFGINVIVENHGSPVSSTAHTEQQEDGSTLIRLVLEPIEEQLAQRVAAGTGALAKVVRRK